jgi:hypothetical protein
MNFLASIYAQAKGPADGVISKADLGRALVATTSGDTAILADNVGSGTSVFSQSKTVRHWKRFRWVRAGRSTRLQPR